MWRVLLDCLVDCGVLWIEVRCTTVEWVVDRGIVPASYLGISSLGKSKKKLGKMGPMVEKKVLPVETDPHKLVNFVCGSNLMKEGSDIPIKPDSEYPDWLWSLHTGKPLPLEELESDPKKYWRRLRKMALRKNSAMKKLNPF